ncbi:MAG TPA: thermonuclease family protein [Asticcacaulis sp.]|nr:thermonuclease family protein [Asticcacaulis sp.]
MSERESVGEVSDHGRQLESLMRVRNDKKPLRPSLWVTLCLALCVLVCTPAGPAKAKPQIISGVGYAIDGDTLVIRKRHIRLFGVDAFERDQTCGRFRCGIEARRALRDLINGQTLRCETQAMDTYGRTVAICRTPAGVDLGGEMVLRGLAVAYRSFSTRYLDEESYARTKRFGAWAYGFKSPLEYRRTSH